MKVFLSQIYIEPGISYPFSYRFQQWISVELSKRVAASPKFIEAYSHDFNLVFNMSAKSSLRNPEIKGPTVFQGTKDVEFTIFLPFHKIKHTRIDVEKVLELLFDSIINVVEGLEIDALRLKQDSNLLIQTAIAQPCMLREKVD